MTHKEYKSILNYELYREAGRWSYFKRFNIRHIQPNTNCQYLARKMRYLYSRGGVRRIISQFYHIRIAHRFGCCIYKNIEVGKGLRIVHPVGIVIGKCSIGENFTLYQNTSIGLKHPGDGARHTPKIGNNVTLSAGSAIYGDVLVADNSFIGAHSLVLKNIEEAGTYVGCPCKRI